MLIVARMKAKTSAALVLSGCLVAGCAGSGYDLSPMPPPGFELTGDWILEPGESEGQFASQSPESTADEPDRTKGGPGVRRTGPIAIGPRQIPVLGARSFVIEQSRDSMGVDYPGRPIRDVTWGRRKWGGRTIDAGWEDGVLLIRTRSHDYRLTERYELSADGKRLTLTIDFEPSVGKDISGTRVYVRHPIPGRESA